MTEDISVLKKKLEEKKKELLNLENEKNVDYLTDDEDFNNLVLPIMYCILGNKNTICIYGIRNKLPISLRPEQWERLYQFMLKGELHKFIKENQEQLCK